MQGNESYADMEDWLYCALTQVDCLPENNRVDRARNARVRQLLRSIEAEHVPIPLIRKDETGVHVLFKFGQRSAEFIVNMTPTIRAIKRNACVSGERFDTIAIPGWPGQIARDVIRWVFPSNYTDVHGMIAAARERL